MQTVWSVNIPQSLGLVESGLDDLGIDGRGNIHISDGVNGSVYRVRPNGETDTTFEVIRPGGADGGLHLAVVPDSSFYVADPSRDRIVRYDSNGHAVGEFTAPGLLALCRSPGDDLYVLASDSDGERINCYDFIGSRIDALCAPRRHRAHLDPELASIDADADGRAYVSYGMPPYRVWRVSRTEVEPAETDKECPNLETWQRDLDHPEDAVLISDITCEPVTSMLWVLLASRVAGRQMLDAFSGAGEFLGSVALPHSDNLYASVCSTGDGALCLLDGVAGDLIRVAVPLL